MDWKERLKNFCPCFTGDTRKTKCDDEKCELKEIQNLLLAERDPEQMKLVQAFIRAGQFTKREILFALTEIYESNYIAAERCVERAVNRLERKNWKVWWDDQNKMKCRKVN